MAIALGESASSITLPTRASTQCALIDCQRGAPQVTAIWWQT
ncbi:hypothetical protein [Methylobacterium pseudosasicola]|nr:hypothetical protein [Methylobacterium pseudosasicola]